MKNRATKGGALDETSLGIFILMVNRRESDKEAGGRADFTIEARVKFRVPPPPMSLLRIGLLLSLAFSFLTTASAQVTLSYLNGEGGAASGTGQSFTVNGADFPTSTAYLTQIQFQTEYGQPGDIYLDIYTTLTEGVFSGYVGSSINSNVWADTALKTWTFDHLALDVDATYYAVYSSDATDGGVVNRATPIQEDVYAGGVLIYSSIPSGSYDAGFSVTLAATAVPEPSTYAMLLGMAVLGIALWHRRR